MKKKLLALAASALLTLGSAGLMAQTILVPTVQNIGPNDLFQDVVGGYPTAQNFYATSAQIGTYGLTLPGAIDGNALIGGDFSSNLFAYTTTPAAVNGTSTYIANRWFAWGGGTSTLTATQQTGAADIPAGSSASLRVNRAGNGLNQVCVGQVVESINARPFQGRTAEFSFQAKAGSTFSAASANLAVYILTGTGADEGSQRAANNINSQGGGGQVWTGGTLLGSAAGYLVPISTGGFNRVSVAAPIAATVNEIAVAICYTPVGNGASTDWFEFTQAQIVANSALTPAVGTAGIALSLNDSRAKTYQFRSAQTEVALQQRYFYSITEPSAGVMIGMGAGAASSTTTCDMTLAFPVTMRITPLFTTTGTALSTATFRIQDSTTSTLATPFLATLVAHTPYAASLRATLTTATTAGFACVLQGAAGGAILNFSAEL